MSYEPPPLEPELLELERELRGLRAMAPDPALFQRLVTNFDEPAFEVLQGDSNRPADSHRWSRAGAFPWRRYAPAAAVAAVVIAVAVPSIPWTGNEADTSQSSGEASANVRRTRPSVEMVSTEPGAPAFAASGSDVPGVLEASQVLGENPGAIVPEPPPQAVPQDRCPFGCLGVRVEPVAETLRAHLKHLSLLPEGGALVHSLVRDGPAHRAGLARYDVITTIDGDPVRDQWHLRELVASRPPGTEVTVGFIRGGQVHSIRIKLAPVTPSA
jgi:hypothetical protein